MAVYRRILREAFQAARLHPIVTLGTVTSKAAGRTITDKGVLKCTANDVAPLIGVPVVRTRSQQTVMVAALTGRIPLEITETIALAGVPR